MRWLLDQARDRGEPVAILWASEGAIYQRFGYGLATIQGTFDIEPDVRSVPPPGRAARAGPDARSRRGGRGSSRRCTTPSARAHPARSSEARLDWRHMLHDCRLDAERERPEVPGGPRGGRGTPAAIRSTAPRASGTIAARTRRCSSSRSSVSIRRRSVPCGSGSSASIWSAT